MNTFREGDSGMILYEGPSLLEPKTPIVVVATEDENPKTGRMLFTWILRQDRPPEVAAYDGSDSAICGDCKFRTDLSAWRANIPFPVHTRTCYVRLSPEEGADEALPPSEVWRKWKRSKTEKTYWGKSKDWECVSGVGWQYRGPLPVRIGSYGDPAAVPTRVWAELVRYAKNWTGYTHMWRTCDQRLKKYAMASVDSPEERDEAQALGWRTFLVTPEKMPRPKRSPWFNEDQNDALIDQAMQWKSEDVLCPATDPKRGKVCPNCKGKQGFPSYDGEKFYICSICNGTGRVSTTCAVCGLCRGTTANAPSVWEVAHGKNKSNHVW